MLGSAKESDIVMKRIKGYCRTQYPQIYGGIKGVQSKLRANRLKRRAAKYSQRSLTWVFRDIYKTNRWGNPESVSGPGSTNAETAAIQRELPDMIRRFGVQSMLDAGCGDLNWLHGVELGLESYIGVDIVPELTMRNHQSHHSPGRRFLTLDITQDDLPRTDLILCRDCLVHLPNATINRALHNFNRTGASYLFTTDFPDIVINRDITLGGWRPLNLQRAPFNLPAPLDRTNDLPQERNELPSKSLALWNVGDICLDTPLSA